MSVKEKPMIRPTGDSKKSSGFAKDDLNRIREHFAAEDKTPWCWLFFGDSITHGAAHTHGWRSFPEIFAERIRWEIQHRQDIVINTGISGNTSDDLLREYDWRCRHWQPQVVFLLIGMNDIVKLDNIDLFRRNLFRLVRQVREDGAIPILQTYGTIQKKTDSAKNIKRFMERPAYNNIIRQIAEDESVILVDHDRHWREFSADPEALAARLGEPIHPGALGHLEMAKEIFRKFDIYDAEANSCNPVGIPFSIPPVNERIS